LKTGGGRPYSETAQKTTGKIGGGVKARESSRQGNGIIRRQEIAGLCKKKKRGGVPSSVLAIGRRLWKIAS